METQSLREPSSPREDERVRLFAHRHEIMHLAVMSTVRKLTVRNFGTHFRKYHHAM